MNKNKSPEEPEKSEEIKRKFLTYFLLFFPTLIIAGIPGKIGLGIKGIITSLVIKCLLAFYQFVVIKNFVDRYYGE